ncbi:VRR-NUC domain-containing protein [Edwardsiella tarda]|uniref:VRR-NUC domain-containing protein n=1 Tax=Edwardsiella tarda TaxID=636 RepID=UPI00351C95CC
MEKNPDLVKGHQEHFLQVRLFDRFERRYPEIYALMHATPNGGARSKVAGAEMQAEGQKKGYPDLSLDAPRGVYHGLRIEMKHGNNKPTKEQKEWLNRLTMLGYCCAVFNDLEAVSDFILGYWGLSAGESMPAQDSDSWWQESAA